MNMRNTYLAAACGVAIGLSSAATHADEFTWQGRLVDNGAPANGVYDFEFELYDMAVGGVTFGGTLSVNDVNVTDGLVTIDLDFGAGAFPGDDRWLQVYVKADADGVFTSLDPRQPLHPTPYAQYAFRAANIGDGGLPGIYSDPINFNNPANQFAGNGSGLTKLNASALLTGNVNAARMPTGGNWSLAGPLNVDSGGFYFDPATNRMGINTSGPSDTLHVAGTGRFTNDMFFGSAGSGNIRFDVSNAQIDTFNGSTNKTRLWGATWGELLLWDSDGDQTVVMTSDGIFGLGAGQLQLRNEDGSIASFHAQGGFNGGGQLILRSSENSSTIEMNGEGITGGVINMYNDAGTRTMLFDSDSGGGSLVTLSNSAALTTISLDGDSGDGAFISLNNAAGSGRMFLDGDSNSGGRLQVDQADGSTGVVIDGDAGTDAGGLITVHNDVSIATIEMHGSETGTDGGQIAVSDSGGDQTILIDGDIGGEARISMHNPANPSASLWVDMDGNSNGRIRLFEATPGGSDEMVLIHTESTGSNAGGQIVLRNDTGTGTIELDGNWAGTGDGRVRTNELEITGGADLSEQFSINAPDGVSVEAGMVVCIDPLNPGKLIVSTQEYDFTVAGIISGAGGVKPGMLMAHNGTVADGDTPVALTGRVYVWCDAGNGAIRPGHLLTTSNIPGHAMRATDREQSHGSIIGKAMTSLDDGTGLVLVLVGLH